MEGPPEMDGHTGFETIPAALLHAAHQFAQREALVDGPVRLRYAELFEQARTCARFFVAKGIRPGDRVAICAPNTYHWPIAALGAQYAGATLVPINTRFTGSEMRDIIERSRASILVVAGTFLGVDRLGQLRAAGLPPLDAVLRIPVEADPPEQAVRTAQDSEQNGERDVATDVVDWAELAAHADPVDPGELDSIARTIQPDDISDILFTSGTTGRSKGAMSAHRQALGVAEAWGAHAQLTTEDNYLVINPFFHSFGYKAGILTALLCGATLYPQRTFDVDDAMRLISAERITVLPGAPTIYQVMLDAPSRPDYDLRSLRLAVTGAATVPVVLVERMQAELSFETVLTAYGLTEAVVATMCHPSDDTDTVATTSGRAAADFDVRVDERTGEIVLRGPNMMRGYLDDPEATAAAIDDEGWLHTGDVGVLDDRGYLTITDRIKDMYICGGFNVYPAEVEQAIARLDGVAESAVIGVPDTRLGEIGKAYIVTTGDQQLSMADVVSYCRGCLANYKVPRQVEFRSELPRNSAGKVLKRVLRNDGDEGNRP